MFYTTQNYAAIELRWFFKKIAFQTLKLEESDFGNASFPEIKIYFLCLLTSEKRYEKAFFDTLYIYNKSY